MGHANRMIAPGYEYTVAIVHCHGFIQRSVIRIDSLENKAL
jgi:hypothetical protein